MVVDKKPKDVMLREFLAPDTEELIASAYKFKWSLFLPESARELGGRKDYCSSIVEFGSRRSDGVAPVWPLIGAGLPSSQPAPIVRPTAPRLREQTSSGVNFRTSKMLRTRCYHRLNADVPPSAAFLNCLDRRCAAGGVKSAPLRTWNLLGGVKL